jgi:hypothetical protein
MNSFDPWRIMQSSPPGWMVVPPPYYGHPLFGEFCEEGRSTFLGAELPSRVSARAELGPDMVLHATVTADGETHEASIDLGPAIQTVLAKIAQFHSDLHAMQGTAVSGDVALCAVDRAVGAAKDALVGALLERHRHPRIGGWWDDVTHAVSSAVNTVTKNVSHYALHPSDIARDVAGHLGAGKTLSNVLSYATDPFQDVTENAAVQNAAASYYGGPAGVAALQAARSAEAGGVDLSNIGQTIKTFGPEIAAAAQHAAGASGGPTASSLAGAIVNATAGKGGAQNLAQSIVNKAARTAKTNPKVAKALHAAKSAVSHVSAAQHVAATADQASAGDPSAAQQVAKIASAAKQGVASAQSLVKTAQSLANGQGLDFSSLASALGGIL